MSDYGSDIEEWTADVLLAVDDTEYGSEVDDAVAKDLETKATAMFARERALELTRYRLRAPIELPRQTQADRPSPENPHIFISDYHQQTGSAFLQLPPELRNSIYATIFEDTTCQLGVVRYRCSHPVAILLACKQTHFEAVGLFYHQAHFIATDYYTLRRCLLKIPVAKRSLSRRVGLHSLDLRRGYDWGDLDQYAGIAEADIDRARHAFEADTRLQVRPSTIEASFLTPAGVESWSERPLLDFEKLQNKSAAPLALQDLPRTDYQSLALDDMPDRNDEDNASDNDDERERRQPIGGQNILCLR
ncbi:hypothetical protein Tdes44962_MAKER02691 [Teratosphaeria destructans]|uniref:F-box domain-containing protein n=1 Tax=Teratosphaeria destructans TaxID=418781 RepID=A0A9W7SSX8_9PEZI|nr:hypothetical protein Tdes44962_MAKER02691 [Teratosphaeria destructans]